MQRTGARKKTSLDPPGAGKLVIPRVELGREAAQKVPRVNGRAPKARSPSSFPCPPAPSLWPSKLQKNSLSNLHQPCFIPESSRRPPLRRGL